jgi:integrase
MSISGIGFLYRQKKNGVELPTLWACVRHNGKRYRISTKTTNESQARKVLAELVKQIGAGVGSLIEPVKPDLTFEELWTLLVRDYQKDNKGLKALHVRHVHLEPFFNGRPTSTIDTDLIDEYVQRRLDDEPEPARASVNRELSALRRAFQLAVDAGKLDRVPKVHRLREDNARTGWFTPQEFSRLYDELPDYFKSVALVGYITGWRVNELLTRQWHHVDFQGLRFRLEPNETKNKEGRTFSLKHGELKAALERQRAWVDAIEERYSIKVPWVFCHDDGTVIKDYYGAWRGACKRGGLEGRIFHDFRRVAVRNLERIPGISRTLAMAMTGHKTESVFRRYSIVDEQDLHDAAEKLEALHAAEQRPAAKVIQFKKKVA